MRPGEIPLMGFGGKYQTSSGNETLYAIGIIDLKNNFRCAGFLAVVSFFFIDDYVSFIQASTYSPKIY